MKVAKRYVVGLAALLGAMLPSAHVAAQEKSLKIVMASTPSFTWLPFLVTRETRFPELSKKIGRPIDVSFSPTTTPAILGLIAGDHDFGVAYVQHAIKAQAEGKDLVVLMAMMDNPTAALVARADLPDLRTIEDLKGSSIGVVGFGSGHHMIGLALVEAAGLKPADVTFRSTGGIAGWIPAMRAKRVDALIASEPSLSRLLEDGVGRIVIDLHNSETTRRVFKGPHPTVALIARKSYVAENPELTRAVVAAHVEALRWIQASPPQEIAKALPEELRKQQNVEQILARVLPAVSKDGTVDPQAVAVTAEWLKRMDEIPAAATIEPSKVVDDSFLRNSRN